MSVYEPEYFKQRTKYKAQDIKNYIDNKQIISSNVRKCQRGRVLITDLGNEYIGRVQMENLEYAPSDNMQAAIMSKVGRTIKVIPIEITSDVIDGRQVVECSRALAQEKCHREFIDKLHNGDVIDVMAVKHESYGVFCDIGCGVIALLPTSKVRIPYIVNPISDCKCLKNFKAVVCKSEDKNKIELSHKELLGTWYEEAQGIKKGDIRIGEVVDIKDYGYFVLLSQNLRGLAESSTEELVPGDTVSVKIIHVNEEKAKIKIQILKKLDKQPVFENYIYRDIPKHIDIWRYHETFRDVTKY